MLYPTEISSDTIQGRISVDNVVDAAVAEAHGKRAREFEPPKPVVLHKDKKEEEADGGGEDAERGS